MLEKSGDDVECMEKYAAADERPQDKCRKDAADCDIYICILAWRYGFIPKQDNPDGKSITELEYDAAPKGRRLVFLLKDDAPWSPALTDSHTGQGKRGRLIGKFRERVGADAICEFFSGPDELAAKVLAAVRKLGQPGQIGRSFDDIEWLDGHARRLEAEFVAHLNQRQSVIDSRAESVYIDVLVRERPSPNAVSQGSEGEPRPLADLAAQAGVRTLILGAGGSGKTTILRKLAADACRRARAQAHAPLPFFARLNVFDGSTNGFDSLLDTIAREADLDRDEVHDLWSQASRRCLFLLDGLNEVRPDLQADCRLALQRLTEKTSHGYVVSSRPSEHAVELVRQVGGFSVADVVQLDANQIRDYMHQAGAGELFDRLEDRLRSLARNPFLLWAIVQSCINLPRHELPRNVGQVYENLIDRYIFGQREVSKPKESRPTRYNYVLVKKPVLARLAVEMCRQGVTRWPETESTLKAIRDHLYELQAANQGLYALTPHSFMPQPIASDLLEELAENGVLQRYGATLEFPHESVRDYFAATEMCSWQTQRIVQQVAPLLWRQVEPGYDAMPLPAQWSQAVIMAVGLQAESGPLLQALADHHPLLAAHCLASARPVESGVEGTMVQGWLRLLGRSRAAYRWVACQCLGAAGLDSAAVARRLSEVVFGDSAWEVRKAAARAFAAIDDPLATEELVARAVVQPPTEALSDPLRGIVRHLQTDRLVTALLNVWSSRSGSDARRRRAEQLFASMRKTALRTALQRLADASAGAEVRQPDTSRAAHEALAAIDGWQSPGLIHAEDLRDIRQSAQSQFQAEQDRYSKEMSAWTQAELIAALKDAAPARRAAAACAVDVGHTDGIAALLDTLAHELYGWASEALLKALKAVDPPDRLLEPWRERMLDDRWCLVFEADSDLGADLQGRQLSARWTAQFSRHGIDLSSDSYLESRKGGWMLLPGSYGGYLYQNPVYRIQVGELGIEVLDAAARARLVFVAEMIGPRAVPVLKALIDEQAEFLPELALNSLGKINVTESLTVLAEVLARGGNRATLEAAIEGLEATRSPLAVAPLIDALRGPRPAQDLGGRIGEVIGKLNAVAGLLDFARQVGLHGDERQRLATVSALCHCGQRSPHTADILLEATSDSSADVRREAVVGLGRLKFDGAQDALVQLCLCDPDAQVREEAGKALRQLAGDAGIPKLTAALGDDDQRTAIRAAEALTRIADDVAIPKLVPLWQTGQVASRIAAAAALFALGFEPVSELVEGLSSLARQAEELLVREAAARLLREMPGGDASLLRPIRAALDAHAYEEVIRLVGSETPFLPDSVDLYVYRAEAKRGMGHREAALEDLDRAIALAPDLAMLHTYRADLLSALGRFPEAVAAAEQAGIGGGGAQNHALVGWYAFLANDLDRSIAASRRALELDPQLAMAAFNLGLAQFAAGSRAEAVEAYQRGLSACAAGTPEHAAQVLRSAATDLDDLLKEHPELAPGAAAIREKLKARASVDGRRLT